MNNMIEFLDTRAVINHGEYAVIPPEGREINVIPGFEGFQTNILSSPKLGAHCIFYISTVQPKARTTEWIGKAGEQFFLYVLDGEGSLTIQTDDRTDEIKQGGFVYLPEGMRAHLINDSEEPIRVIMYKQKYKAIEGIRAEYVVGDANLIPEWNHEGIDNIWKKNLLPTHMGFDMNFHILGFEPAACHPWLETHVQEHGAYVLSGQGFYRLGKDWVQVQKDDYIWMGPFSVQGSYSIGRERFSYIYSKDCNRDEEL
jgi:(S)-ureidoglycine aminohydrolase